MDFIDFMKFCGLFATIYIIHGLFFAEKRGKRSKVHYTRPAWNFYLKKIYAEFILKREIEQNKDKKIDNELRNREVPRILSKEDSFDSQNIFGNDENGNSFVLKFERRRHRIAEVWLILRLQNGDIFTFPKHPNSVIVNTIPRAFEGAGLKLECLIPYSKWRITYSGWMRKGITESYPHDDDEQLHFVKINFFWTAASDPLFWPYDLNRKLIATSLATEKWRDSKFLDLVAFKGSGGYEQSGSCFGEVKIYETELDSYINGIPNHINIELNLPGMRKRYWGSQTADQVYRTAFITGTISDGIVFEVGATSGKNGLTNLQFGKIFTPLGHVRKVDWTDFHLESIGENPYQLPEKSIINLKANKKSYKVSVRFLNDLKAPIHGETSDCKWKAFIVPVELKWNDQKGLGSAVFWYPQNKSEFKPREIPSEIRRNILHPEKISIQKSILLFNDKDAQIVEYSGGKGSSLAILKEIKETKGASFFDNRHRSIQILNALVDQASSLNQENNLKSILKKKYQRNRTGSMAKVIFPDPNDIEIPEYEVPDGFIVSIGAFLKHLNENPKIKESILSLENVVYRKIEGKIEIECEKVCEVFKNSKLSDELKKELKSEIDELCEKYKNVRFAVRSSGITEDGEESSTAGQNETFLGLKNENDIFDAIIKCWSSLFTIQSVSYRIQHIQPISTQMSVVVQVMVNATSAGVLFTRHPYNGDPRVIVITANFGLGESVVSGKSEVDTFYVQRNFNDKIEYLGSNIVEKSICIKIDNQNSIEEVKCDNEMRNKACLSEEIVMKLAELGVIMEKFFGTPRDIEFAVIDDKIYLLQSRPITSLNNLTEFEILHESDTAVMSNVTNVWTRANIGEVITGPYCYLHQSFICKAWENLITTIATYEKPSNFYGIFFPINSHYSFINVGSLILSTINEEPSIFEELSALGIFGHNIYEKHPNLAEIAAKIKNFQLKWNNLGSLNQLFFSSSKYDIAEETLKKVKFQHSTEQLQKLKTSSDVLDLLLRSLKDYSKLQEILTNASMCSSLYQVFSFKILTQGSKKLILEHKIDFATILSEAKNFESATIPAMIRSISEAIYENEKSEEFLSSENCIEWMKQNCPKGFEAYEIFMKTHGHRGINEMEISAKSWSEEPNNILEMIKSNLNHHQNSSTEEEVKTSSINEIFAKLKTPLKSSTKLFLRFLLPRCIRGVEYRERAKSYLVSSTNELRRSFRYMAKLMVNEGLLPNQELIYHLSVDELRQIMDNRDGKIISKAMRRMKLQENLQDLKFPEITFGIPRPITNDKTVKFDGNILVKGTPVCIGVVTARACVCKSFEDVYKIQKGDILVTYSTDIAWSPYFPILGGVVTEIGGLISHGAVVAREYGLPCIVAATNATNSIEDGQVVTLNAENGTIISQ